MWVYGMREKRKIPKFGYIRHLDIESNKYHRLIVYNRKLEQYEIDENSLDYLGLLTEISCDCL